MVHNKWHQLLLEQLQLKFDADKVNYLFNNFGKYLQDEYFNTYNIDEAVTDIEIISSLSDKDQYKISLSANINIDTGVWSIKLLKLNDPVSLSRGLPIIENFGVKLLEEHPIKISLDDTKTIHVCNFIVEVPKILIEKIKDPTILEHLKIAIVSTFNRNIENDSLNRLVLSSGLDFRKIELLRAITKYLVQTTLPFSSKYIADCLCLYANITSKLYELFHIKFNVSSLTAREQEVFKPIEADILSDLTAVESLDHDRILKAFLNIIQAMLRTNFYQVNDNDSHDSHNTFKNYISFKLDSKKIPFLPKPTPLYEIFVYSLRFEAIHLRGGKVARGGLRWSDRAEDFRTEVLGLVKAQMVKNSVIVPTGSKGGFICKKLPSITQREEYMAEGVRCYKLFITALLELTDNIVASKVVHPQNVVIYDDVDPYLVVAADKGTATFSDYANAISKEHNFWLGDAFASGGSAGYDHKKMGITAKGAWESAKRHFRHMGVDIQNQSFTVIGIGDMSGDVFGNGMLLSKHIKLVAAFNHQHIFIDPNPMTDVAYKERLRLFNLASSSFANYDLSKISSGGGVFSRASKFITLTQEMKDLLQIPMQYYKNNIINDEVSPTELINLLLKAPFDLLYNGGIGTYIKSSAESNEMVKDKANDLLRVNGNELRVKVLVEGGNLGATQLGRIEFAKTGGRIYTDAIDNSAGVDCSDHEVNIKILFADIMQHENLTINERNQILSDMTDDVAQLVLRDNELQTEVLQYALARSPELLMINANYVDKLEKNGEIDRAIEFLPNNAEIQDRVRTSTGFTTPELSVLLAYSKMILDRQLLTSDIVNSDDFLELLLNYFPAYLRNNYVKYIKNHYLKKEIIANQLANLVVNHMGITFISRFEDEFHLSSANIVVAFWVAYKLLDAENIFSEIEKLDNLVDANLQIEMIIRFKKSLERLTRWILRKFQDKISVPDLLSTYTKSVHQVMYSIDKILESAEHPEIRSIEEKLLNAKVPHNLSILIARSNNLPQLLDIAILSHNIQYDIITVANNYFYIGKILHMDWLRKNLIALPENNKWQALSRSALLFDYYSLYSYFVENAIKLNDNNLDANFAANWIKKYPEKVSKINAMLEELMTYKQIDLAMLSAVIRELYSLR